MGLAIAAIIIVLILCLRISVRLNTEDGTALWIGVGFIRVKLGAREKLLKLRDFEIKRYRRLHGEKKTAVKAKTSKNDKKADEKRRKNTETQLGEREKTDIPALIKKLTGVAQVFISRFGKHLRVDLRRIIIITATGDAASTAILYGAVIGAVQNLYAILTSTGTLRTGRRSELIVEPDFLSEKPTVIIDTVFSFRLWQLFDMAIRSGIRYLKNED